MYPVTIAGSLLGSKMRFVTMSAATREKTIRALCNFSVVLSCAVLIGCQSEPPQQSEDTIDDAEDIVDVAARLALLSPEDRLLALASKPVPWFDLGELAISLYDARLSMHVMQTGPVIDLGEASALKHIQGRWRAPWLARQVMNADDVKRFDRPDLLGRGVVWNEGTSASLRFPVPDDLSKDTPYRCIVRLRPKNNRRVEVRLNDHAKTVELRAGWQTISVPFEAKTIRFGGENRLTFVFAGSFFEGSDRVAAQFDFVRLVPADHANALLLKVQKLPREARRRLAVPGDLA